MDDLYSRIIIPISLITLAGAGMTIGINNKCKLVSQSDCLIFWGLSMSAVVGGIILTEAFIFYRIKHYEQQMETFSETKTETEVKQQLPGRYVWLRSVIRLSLATLLLSLPVIIQGAFVATVFGVLIGFGLVLFIRGILNRLPPKY